MPYLLIDVTPSKDPVASGGATVLTITYEAPAAATVHFRCSEPFTFVPPSKDVGPSSATGGTATVSVTITRAAGRGPADCNVLCTLEDARAFHCIVGVL